MVYIDLIFFFSNDLLLQIVSIVISVCWFVLVLTHMVVILHNLIIFIMQFLLFLLCIGLCYTYCLLVQKEMGVNVNETTSHLQV